MKKLKKYFIIELIKELIILTLLIFDMQTIFKMHDKMCEQDKKIKEQENKIQQQIELIDALQQ